MGYLNYWQVNSAEQAQSILSLTYDEPYVTTLAQQYVDKYLNRNDFAAVQSELSRIEDGSYADRTKINKIIDVIEAAANAGKITRAQETELLKQYGLL